jgi:hypothetical protein
MCTTKTKNDPTDFVKPGLYGEDTLIQKLQYAKQQLITKEDVRMNETTNDRLH